ncbi:AMP-binding protein, partial [Rhodococcus sp. CX]|uniref:AMP-binding protein n=1 Tax=Rhodococcus sp. CX TaxID=2789880 RepID=UPI0035A87699
MTTHALSARIAAVLALAPDSPMVEFDDAWVSRGRMRDAVRRIASTPGADGEVGILLRNRPEFVAALLGVLAVGGTVVVINPARGDDRTRADIAALRLPLIIGGPDDLRALVAPLPGTVTVELSGLDAEPHLIPATVGPELRDSTGARPFVLLPRFELDRWIAAVRTHRPRAVSLVPAALRTVLHSDLGREDLASIEVVTSGTAPLSADDADAFHDKFGIPVLTSYAATEFGGGVAGWTLPEHRRYWQTKRGSVGRASGG